MHQRRVPLLVSGRLLLALVVTLSLTAVGAPHNMPHPLFLLVGADIVAAFRFFLLVELGGGVEIRLTRVEEGVMLLSS
jgi:hypothetical protein